MKAVAWNRYGPPDVLTVIDAAIPVPADNEVLVRVHASAITSGDVRLRSFDIPGGFWLPARLMFGVFRPRKKIPGMNLAGEVHAVGRNVTRFRVGDAVYGTTGMHMGAHAGFVCLDQSAVLTAMPRGLSFEQAASTPFGGLTAIQFLMRKASLQQGHSIMVNGASGGVGTAAVQLAAHLGATVTGVCSARNAALVQSLGAHQVIDYANRDVTQTDQTYDLILDTVGNLALQQCRPLLNAGGKLIAINVGLMANLTSVFHADLVSGVADETLEDLELLKTLLESGDIKPVVDKVFTIDRVVDAHRYLETDKKTGNVVLTMTGNASNDSAA